MLATTPRRLLPMLATPSPPFDDPACIYEAKWDGVRALVAVDEDRVRVWGGHGIGAECPSGTPSLVWHRGRALAIRAIPAIAPRSPTPYAQPPMTDVTRILSAIQQGDRQASAQLLPLVYDELRALAAAKLAHEKPGQTLQATALVHEAYLRLVGGAVDMPWNSRGHFIAAAAEAMRRILVESARRKQTAKHGGVRRRIDLSQAEPLTEGDPDALLDLDEAWPALLRYGARQRRADHEVVR